MGRGGERPGCERDAEGFVFLILQLTCPINILPEATTDSTGDVPIVTSITHPT